MKELDHLHVELAGTNLIEASAGTGKTYAIACLYLRLLIEQGLTPEKILVVTYTEAATEELRGRVRARIRETLELFEGGTTSDPFLEGLFGNVSGRGPGREEARERLDRALKGFDQAAIFTIHGFCMRALQDNAFESGSLYDTELLGDQGILVREIVDDFWRRQFFREPAHLLGYALRQGLTPETLTEFLRSVLGSAQLQILPALLPGRIPVLEGEILSLFGKLQSGWRARGAELRRLFEEDPGLSRSAGLYRPDLLPALFQAMEDYAGGDDPYEVFDDFVRFTASGVLEKKKKKPLPLEDPFLELCEELDAALSERFLALRSELLAFAQQQLPARKRELNVRGYDDLLTGLYDGLCAERGEELAASLRQKYCAALIDEFQDTDPVQFEIFRKVYGAAGLPLFLIGDPKQAIYSFRGADIFAYLEASGGVEGECRFTLTRNWRSAPKLLDAINAVFDNGRRPFVFDQISFHPARAGNPGEGDRLALTGADPAPLQLWHLPAPEGKAMNVTQATKSVPAAVAAEIARLLQDGSAGKALIDGGPVLPEHIAVIVKTHRQAGVVQDALVKLGIPSVLRSTSSIFATHEARELCTLLGALAAPASEPKVRAALVTDILGLSGDDIAGLQEDEALWEERLSRFRELHKTWLERGFMVMARVLLAREGVRGRLLRRVDGERRLTNILHCLELLHKASREHGLGAEGLVTWFGERISSEECDEEQQVRLETDEKAVKILTIHVSKGLEYPIVFCPFLWAGVREGDEVISYHEGFTLTKDFGSPGREKAEAAAQKESLAEYLRLLYVALTRAKFRCYLVAGKFSGKRPNRPETSPLSYLFHASPGTRRSADLVAELAQEVKGLPPDEAVAQLEALAAGAAGAVAVAPMPEPGAPPRWVPGGGAGESYSCRSFARTLDRDWRVSSFTSLSSHDLPAAELPDHDGGAPGESPAPAVRPEPEAGSIFSFPRGASAGIFLHGIFEKLDFHGCTGVSAAWQVRSFLKAGGLDEGWAPCLCEMIRHVVQVPLPAPEGPFCLADLERGKWLSELEFFLPLQFVTSGALREFFGKWAGLHGGADLLPLCQALRFRPVRGMLKGYMDMVFEHGGRYYLVDWKSNHLGHRLEDYGQASLKGAMEKGLYTLQYLLYTVALNRYLTLRVPGYDYERHFGGSIYVFLRGVNRDRGADFGLFRDTPPAALIQELTDCLIQAGG
jgi:exodeoxyribonuclease V beta subunit